MAWYIFVGLAVVVVLLASGGCETKSKAKAQSKAAYLAGQKQGAAMQAQENSVWMVGNVRTPLIPWTPDLTLVKALITADYQGAGDPHQITIRRYGKPAIDVNPRALLQGDDMSLEAGDRVEIKP